MMQVMTGRERTRDAEIPARTVSTVFHVGDLSEQRERPRISYEGDGLSVSKHPEAWRRILRETGHTASREPKTYELTADDGTLYDAVPGGPPRDRVVEWCLDRGYVDVVDGFAVRWEQNGATTEMLFYDEDTAQTEADAVEERAIDETTLLTLDEKGEAYWDRAFRQAACKAEPLVIRGLTPVWFAEEHGFDGVWWDERLAPADFSAPRGVIFQDALARWDRTLASE